MQQKEKLQVVDEYVNCKYVFEQKELFMTVTAHTSLDYLEFAIRVFFCLGLNTPFQILDKDYIFYNTTTRRGDCFDDVVYSCRDDYEMHNEVTFDVFIISNLELKAGVNFHDIETIVL
jgi:hypothetical protein